MNQEFLSKIRSAHFVGVGGIGVSALARLFLAREISVSGSDRELSRITADLDRQGVRIFSEHDSKNVPDVCDLVIYSPAVRPENPELLVAHERGILTLSYPEALGMVSRGMRTIAVSGTHGKTTTTAMIAGVLVGARVDPTVIVGSLLKSGTNFIGGSSDIFVVEACEYKRSFLNLSPEILVITNIDNDHLDYYGNIEGVQKAFAELVEKVPASGAIICDPNDPLVLPVLKNATAKIVDYTLGSSTPKLSVPGEHNIRNAKATLAVANILGVDTNEALRFLGEFQGTWRRQEFKGKTVEGALVYDDYAHHPTEIKATLQGFRAKYPEGKIWAVFQPHLYSRTKLLLGEFAQSFGDADEVILAPIYASREALDPEITSEILADAIRTHNSNVRAYTSLSEIENHLRDTLTSKDIIITMGAGDIFKVGESLLV